LFQRNRTTNNAATSHTAACTSRARPVFSEAGRNQQARQSARVASGSMAGGRWDEWQRCSPRAACRRRPRSLREACLGCAG